MTDDLNADDRPLDSGRLADSGPVKKPALIPALAWTFGIVAVLITLWADIITTAHAFRTRPPIGELPAVIARWRLIGRAAALIPTAAIIASVISFRLDRRTRQMAAPGSLLTRVWMAVALSLLAMVTCRVGFTLWSDFIVSGPGRLKGSSLMDSLMIDLWSCGLMLIGAIPAAFIAAIWLQKTAQTTV